MNSFKFVIQHTRKTNQLNLCTKVRFFLRSLPSTKIRNYQDNKLTAHFSTLDNRRVELNSYLKQRQVELQEQLAFYDSLKQDSIHLISDIQREYDLYKKAKITSELDFVNDMLKYCDRS